MLKTAIKKTAMTKVLSCFLVFVILMSVIPVSVSASDGSDVVRGDVLKTLSGGSDLSDCVFGSPKEAIVGENTKLNFVVSLTEEPCESRVAFRDEIQWFIYKPDETEIEGEKVVLTSSCAGGPCDNAYYDFPDVGVYTIKIKFLDTGDWASWTVSATNPLCSISNLAHYPYSPKDVDTVNLYADVTSESSISSVKAYWSIDKVNWNIIDMKVYSVNTNTYITESRVPAQAAGTTVHYKIHATNSGGTAVSSTSSYKIQATTTGSLTGRVTDSSGEGINGATVTLGIWTTKTDLSAHYSFIGKAKGVYDFKVEKPGYNIYIGTATVGTGKTPKDVQLTTGQSPEIELTPSSHDFGEVQTTVSTTPFSFTIKNVGGGTATGEVYLTGSGKDQFIIASGKGSFSLDVDQTKTISVAFCPTSAGSKSATLYAKGSNCNDVQSPLSGTGGEIEPSPHELDYDNIAKYMSSAITFYSGYTDNWFNTKYWHNLGQGTVSGGVSNSFEKSFNAPAKSLAEQFVYPKYLHSTLGAASIAEGIVFIGASYLSIFYGMSYGLIRTLIDKGSSYSKIITDLNSLKENSKNIKSAAENRDENTINKLFITRKNILEELYRKLPMYDFDVRTNANRGNEYWHRTFLTSGASYNAYRTVKSFIISLHLQLQEDYIFTTYQLNRIAGRESFEELNLVVNAPIPPTRFDNDPGCSVLIGCVDAIGGSNEFEIILGANDVSSNKELRIELAYCPKTKDDLDGITMYVKYGEKPTTSSYDEKGRHITIKNPKQGSYYVLLKAENVPGMYKLVAQVYKPNWLLIPICKSVTINSKGFVFEQYPQPEVVDIRVDKSEISLNEWVTLTVKVTNKGGTASWQSIAISSPNVTSVDSYEILSHNIDYFEKYDIGYEAGFNYGTGTKVLEYPLIEGGKYNWSAEINA